MTIVGVTDYGNGLYFDNRVGQMLWQAVVCKELLWNYVYGVDKNMEGEAFSFTEEMARRYEEIAQRYGEVQELFFMADLNTEGKDTVQGLRLSYAGTNSAKLVGYVKYGNLCHNNRKQCRKAENQRRHALLCFCLILSY